MTDELAGGVDAPAEAPAVAETPAPEPTEQKAEPTPRGAIDRAFEKLDAMEKGDTADKAEAKPEKAVEAKPDDRPRNPDGTFAAKAEGEPEKPTEAKPEETTKKESGPIAEPPARFSADAKAAWANVPDPVKGEVHRALREAEQGIEKYRNDASRYGQVWKPFEDMAAASRLDPVATLKGYVQIDQLLAQDFDKGVEAIFAKKGEDVRQWAARIANGAEPSQQDRVVSDLKREISGLKQQIAGLGGTVQQTQQAHIDQGLQQFKRALPEADQNLFQELDEEIGAELLSDPSATLAQAFERAKTKANERYSRLFGQPHTPAVPSPPPAAPQTGTPAPTAQTGKGQLSVTGAPASGSDPATRKTPSSPRAALDNAFAQLGL